ncbi:solute carrier family 15 member 4 [Aplysia californica]|uniref:Solute carrier family 15 member 4 n=1 Tax=Aplysia californica TaxID=6500 RepID=A0ABM0JIZ1_APLCA|nr:solute carrier family 15 member 4 [Aplysia californica]XP_035824714.1 solute carrier family 15 member 4 [Aplysia californica]
MLEASESESEPLLKPKKWSTLTISDDEFAKDARQRTKVNVKYEPKLSTFSPQKLAIIMCVLLVEMCERMAYYGVIANLVLYCTSVLDYTSNTATTISLVFSGTVYFIPIIGGYIADAWSSRFNVIFGSGLIYFCGLFSLLSSSIEYSSVFDDPDNEMQTEGRRTFYILGLVLVAIGTGGIKANVGPFGAQQVQDLGADAVQIYFNWFYFFVNAGGLVAFTAIAYVQQNISFAWGFLIPILSMFLALILLNVARQKYIYKEGEGSVLGSVFRICGQGICRQSPFIDGKRRMFDSARREYGGGFDSFTVDGVIAILRMLPVFFFVIMFWAIYSQMQSTYFLQGERMDLSLGSVLIPVAFLNAFNTVAVLIIIPVLDRLVYPCFKRLGRPLSYLQRIGFGFLLSASSVFLAGGVEIERKKHLGFHQVVGKESFYAANVSVFIQAPQFFLVGAGEAFTSIAGYEFAYTQAPKTLQGAIMGVFLATNGLGSYLSTAILAIVEAVTKDDPWFPDDINKGKAEYVFFLFGGLMILFFLGYIPIARWYKYQEYLTDEEVKAKAKARGPDNEQLDQQEYEHSNTFF